MNGEEESKQEHADHVARAMKRIDEPEATHVATVMRRPRKSLRWGAIAIAASILLALFFVIDGGGTSATAMAAIERSLNVAAEQMTRKYLLQVHYRTPAGQEAQSDIDLYVRGHGRFAFRHPGLLPRSSFWLGKNETEEWVVPPIGPVRIGSDTVLSRWLASYEQLDTPYLHVTTLLTRMSRGYRLKKKSNEEVTLPDGTKVACEHTHPELEMADEANAPDTIVLTFQSDEPSRSDEWSAPEAHYQGRRVIVRVHSLGQPTLERP